MDDGGGREQGRVTPHSGVEPLDTCTYAIVGTADDGFQTSETQPYSGVAFGGFELGTAPCSKRGTHPAATERRDGFVETRRVEENTGVNGFGAVADCVRTDVFYDPRTRDIDYGGVAGDRMPGFGDFFSVPPPAFDEDVEVRMPQAVLVRHLHFQKRGSAAHVLLPLTASAEHEERPEKTVDLIFERRVGMLQGQRQEPDFLVHAERVQRGPNFSCPLLSAALLQADTHFVGRRLAGRTPAAPGECFKATRSGTGALKRSEDQVPPVSPTRVAENRFTKLNFFGAIFGAAPGLVIEMGTLFLGVDLRR